MAKALICDLDGTLFDTYPEIYAAVAAAARGLGLELAADEQAARGFMGGGLSRFAKRVLTGEMDGEPDPEDHERLFKRAQLEYKHLLLSRNSLYDGVPETLRDLREEGWQLAIATNKLEMFTRPLLECFLGDIDFACVRCRDSQPQAKPDPAMVHDILARLGLAPVQALFVGDTLVDVATARAAGVRMIGVSYGYHLGEDARELGADHLIDDFAELLPLVRRLVPAGK
ncbi:MAG: HAD-IA family hydrolase [Betaproteobacteria bacterium AqS2]|uniref:phosphoglycolate phosphatase n=1 Tax=Candidatus Amphirhobacter heronislandensis TaxID=1732024 RepID=A0A930UGQ4_9GAMM|nr:HAD-IA family hydrolase [Betaproteobacteria bacterium AqS2]